MTLLRRWSAVVLLLALSSQAARAEDVKAFYTGKTIKLFVGLPPGGGADAYARLVQRHFGRFVPGAPRIVSQNMPGAGSLRSVMALTSSPDDGTAMVHFSSALLTEAITAPDKVKLDFRSFNFIGNVSEDVRVCYVRSASGIRTWAAMLAANLVVFGATAPGTAGNVDTAMLRNLFGIKLRQVQGYAGSADKRIAIERGEIDGDCGGFTSSSDSHRPWCRGWIAISPGVAIWCAMPMNDRSMISWWRRSGSAACSWWRDVCRRSGLRRCAQPSMRWWPI